LKEGFERKQQRRQNKEIIQKRTNTDKKTYISKKDEDKAIITIEKERGKKDSKNNSKENKIKILYSLLTRWGRGI
jgi:hypothetical protein